MNVPRICLFLFFLLAQLPVQAQQKYILGKVLDADNQQGIELATVVNQRTKQTTRSNKKGAFFFVRQPRRLHHRRQF